MFYNSTSTASTRTSTGNCYIRKMHDSSHFSWRSWWPWIEIMIIKISNWKVNTSIWFCWKTYPLPSLPPPPPPPPPPPLPPLPPQKLRLPVESLAPSGFVNGSINDFRLQNTIFEWFKITNCGNPILVNSYVCYLQ